MFLNLSALLFIDFEMMIILQLVIPIFVFRPIVYFVFLVFVANILERYRYIVLSTVSVICLSFAKYRALQMLHMDVAKMLQKTRITRKDHSHWTTDARKISYQCHKKPKIQHYHVFTTGTIFYTFLNDSLVGWLGIHGFFPLFFFLGPLSTIQILFKSLLPDYGELPVHTRHPNRIFVHILGTFVLCTHRHHLSRSCR